MDRFRTMESFVRVVRSGSFTAAASQIGLSRALVSRHVADLERRVRVRLLNRTTRSVRPTEEGERYLAVCEGILADLARGEQSITQARTDLAGPLRVVAPKSFGTVVLADAVIAFQRSHPRIQLSLTLEDYSFRPYDFVEGGFDFAIRLVPMRDSSVIARRIATLDLVLCAAPHYLAQRRPPATLADIARHPCLVHVAVDASDRVWRFQGAKGVKAIKVKGAFLSNSALVLRKATLAGLGVALLPRYCIDADLAAGNLVPLLPRHRPEPRPILAVYPRAVPLALKVRAFSDFLARWFSAPAPAPEAR